MDSVGELHMTQFLNPVSSSSSTGPTEISKLQQQNKKDIFYSHN